MNLNLQWLCVTHLAVWGSVRLRDFSQSHCGIIQRSLGSCFRTSSVCTCQQSKVSHCGRVESARAFGSFPKIPSLYTALLDLSTVLNATPPKTNPIKAITKKHPLGAETRREQFGGSLRLPASSAEKNAISVCECQVSRAASKNTVSRHRFLSASCLCRLKLNFIPRERRLCCGASGTCVLWVLFYSSHTVQRAFGACAYSARARLRTVCGK